MSEKPPLDDSERAAHSPTFLLGCIIHARRRRRVAPPLPVDVSFNWPNPGVSARPDLGVEASVNVGMAGGAEKDKRVMDEGAFVLLGTPADTGCRRMYISMAASLRRSLSLS